MARFTYIKLDDWCGLYDGDILVHEGHDIDLRDFARKLEVFVDFIIYPDKLDEYVSQKLGRMPWTLTEAKEHL